MRGKFWFRVSNVKNDDNNSLINYLAFDRYSSFSSVPLVCRLFFVRHSSRNQFRIVFFELFVRKIIVGVRQTNDQLIYKDIYSLNM